MKINNTIYTQAREVSEATRTLIKGLKYVKRILGGEMEIHTCLQNRRSFPAEINTSLELYVELDNKHFSSSPQQNTYFPQQQAVRQIFCIPHLFSFFCPSVLPPCAVFHLSLFLNCSSARSATATEGGKHSGIIQTRLTERLLSLFFVNGTEQ